MSDCKRRSCLLETHYSLTLAFNLRLMFFLEVQATVISQIFSHSSCCTASYVGLYEYKTHLALELLENTVVSHISTLQRTRDRTYWKCLFVRMCKAICQETFILGITYLQTSVKIYKEDPHIIFRI